jgi:Secretion system C-terminal sorting domain
MKKFFAMAIMAMLYTTVFGLNIITNPGFESGTIPFNPDQVAYAGGWSKGCGTVYCNNCTNYSAPGSPDLFDRRSTSTCYDFSNKWAANLPERTAGNRYVGFSGGHFKTSTNSYFYGETVLGTINDRLIENCPYAISFYAARTSVIYDCAGASGFQYGAPNADYNKIEVVLRKANDCNTFKSVFVSSALNSTAWTQYSGQFTLNATEAAVGYDRIELRYVATPNEASNSYRTAFLDDVSLEPGNTPISADFGLTATSISGNQTNYLVTATVASVPAYSGFSWEVSEVNVNTGAVIPGTSMYNPSNWWVNSLYYTNSFPGYCCNSVPTTGNGTFLMGRKYRITRGTWGPCTEWTTVTKTVFMDVVGRSGGPVQPVIETVTDYMPKMPNDLMDATKNLGPRNTPNFKIYPNPTESQFTVESGWGEQKFSVMIFDAFGKTILKFDASEPYTTVDASPFEPGIYFVRFVAGDHVETQKLIRR